MSLTAAPDPVPNSQSGGKEDGENTERKAFQRRHWSLFALLSLIFVTHAIGVFIFTKGFLLTRLILDDHSSCAEPPFPTHSENLECWHPKAFEKAVIIVIDALRYDFVTPQNDTEFYHNNLPFLYNVAVEQPTNAFLLPFIADPPTTTLVRIKGLTTGSLPTFIDAGSNFGGEAIEEDNLLWHLKQNNRRMVLLGDDTWQDLFPGYFDSNLSRPLHSFDTTDLHTVDNIVIENIFPLLQTPEKWDVIIAHFLGVDHAGHRYGPDHPAMRAKQNQMDDVLRRVADAVEDDTLLIVMGDHGMDVKGDHGGETDEEVEAALWMYSKTPRFGRAGDDSLFPPKTAKERPIPQIDLVPTFALLMGLPIPFNNLGSPIQEAFLGPYYKGFSALAQARVLAGGQIRKYQAAYQKARGDLSDTISDLDRLWATSFQSYDGRDFATTPNTELKEINQNFFAYQRANLDICKALWARFDLPAMFCGVIVLAFGLIALLGIVRSYDGKYAGAKPSLVAIAIAITVSLGVVLFMGHFYEFSGPEKIDFWLLVAGLAIPYLLIHSFAFGKAQNKMSLWTGLGCFFILSQSIGYASNSFTIWEDEMLLFFLATFAAFTAFASLRQAAITDRALGAYHAILFLLMSRLASLSRLCRDEQIPICESTYYASTTSTTSAPWHIAIPFIVALLLPSLIRSYFDGTRSYEGVAPVWLGLISRAVLFAGALHWTLQAADDGEWFDIGEDQFKLAKLTLARVVLATSFLGGSVIHAQSAPCVRVEMKENGLANSEPRTAVTVFGYANVHGSLYGIFVVSWLLGIGFLQKPVGQGIIAILGIQIFSLAEMIDTNDLSSRAIGGIVLALLGSFHFFKTGHQAVLSSIQWDSAWLAVPPPIKYPWSPLSVILNTFGSQFIAAVALPLIVLWKQPLRASTLVQKVGKAIAAHILYYATINLATTMWAGHLRRHLMLYRIFSPRFMTGAVVLLLVDVACVVFALFAYWQNTRNIAKVFRWKETKLL